MALKEHLDKIVDEAESYAEAKIEQTRLETVSKSINILTGVLSWLIIAGIALFIMGTLSLIGLLLLAKLTGGFVSACLIILGFYVIIFVVLFIFHERLLSNPIRNFLLGEYLHNYKIKKHE